MLTSIRYYEDTLVIEDRPVAMCVSEEHDPFCDALHLDKAALPVASVVHPVTGAERVIHPGKITVTRKDQNDCVSIVST